MKSFALIYDFGVAGGVGGGGVGLGPLAGGKVFRRNSSRMPALAGSVAGHWRSAAFWRWGVLIIMAI